jgi:hypothetical protein
MTKINMQLRKDFTQKQAERGGSFDTPPIPFIPEESSLNDMETHELTLLIDPKGVGSAKNNTYKLKAKVFQCGSTEDLLVWLDELQTIFRNKPCTQADSKFDIVQLLTSGDARTYWRGMANAEKLKKDPSDLAGVKTIGATDESYKATMNLWLKHHLPRDAERLQKTYLRNHIRKPEKLSIKVANLRLTAINEMLKYFIAPDNSIPLILTDDELSDIVYRFVKNPWRVKMRDMGKRVTSYANRDDLVEYFEQLEVNDTIAETARATASSNKTAKEKSSPGRKSTGNTKRQDKGSHNGSDTGAKRPKFETRFCKLCDKYGGKSDTHNTDVCKKYKADGTRMSTFGRQQSSHQTEELFATIAKMEKKLTKMSAKSKKAKKRRKYESDSSDDDSD